MKELWQKISKTYGLANDLEEINRNTVAEFIRKNISTGDSVLDLGCGNGRVLSKISDISKINITGVDSSAEMLEECHQIKADNLELVKADVLDFINNPGRAMYRFVFSLNTLHNFSNRQEIDSFLLKVGSQVRPGGFLIFDIRNKFNPFISRGYSRSRSQGYNFFTFSYLRAVRLLRRQGYKIIKIKPVNYRTIEQAGKSNASKIFKVFYWLYLKINRLTIFSPYILILAQKKPEKFVSIIWGYHPQLAKLSPIENYHLHDLKIARSLGYDTELLMIAPNFRVEDDPNFVVGTKVSQYSSSWNYIKFLFKNRSAIIYANTYTWQSFLAPLICRRVVFMGHDSVMRKNWRKQLFQDLVFKLFYRIRVINQEEKNFLLKHGVKETKIFVVPLAIDVANFLDQGEQARKNLVFLGNVTFDKNVPDILQALSIVRKDFPEIKLEIIGEVRDERFNSMVKDLKLEDSIIIHGFVPHASLAKYLDHTLIYLNSSISEGQCLAAYEAILAGNVLCLPRTLSFVGVFKDCALFHDLYQGEEMAQNIINYLKHPELLKSHLTIGQKLIADNYNDQVITTKTKMLFS